MFVVQELDVQWDTIYLVTIYSPSGTIQPYFRKVYKQILCTYLLPCSKDNASSQRLYLYDTTYWMYYRKPLRTIYSLNSSATAKLLTFQQNPQLFWHEWMLLTAVAQVLIVNFHSCLYYILLLNKTCGSGSL